MEYRTVLDLVMTLLVREEADIIRDNIEFHLARGVDFIIATDNGSTDGTREILAEYESQGVLRLLDEPGRDYEQGLWVSRMAALARDEHKADWILNNDADEYWMPDTGTLKEAITAVRSNMVLCKRRNMLFAHDGPAPSSLRDDLRWHVVEPIPVPALQDQLRDPLPCPYYYLDLPPKALCRSHGLLRVHQGNHDADYAEISRETSGKITIYHYPIRSFEQFVRKVSLGGSAYLQNQTLPVGAGWHWRRWYRMLQEGKARSAFQETLPSTERLNEDLRTGHVREDSTLCTE